MWQIQRITTRTWSRSRRTWSDSQFWRSLTASTTPASPPPPKKEEKKPSSTPSSVLPGLGLSAGVAAVGFGTASTLSAGLGIPLSGIPVSIALGFGLRNTLLRDEGTSASPQVNMTTFQPGLTTASKTVLQAGIVCVAAKLSAGQVLATSTGSIPVVVGAVGAGLLVIPRLGRLAGLPTTTSLLLTAGTSICGVTAISALAPAIQAPPRDVAVAVANTVAFGTLGMLAYPYLLHSLFDAGAGASTPIGMSLGVAIHDTSQVLGAALSYKETFGDEVAFQTAAVTKLLRNLGLAVAIPALTYAHHKELLSSQDKDSVDASVEETPTTMSGLNTFSKFVPPFLYAFLGMSALRSVGDMVLVGENATQFTTVMNFLANDVSKVALGTAMAAVGLSTSAASLKGVGWQPFLVGGAGAFVVGGTGISIAMLMA